MENEYKIGAVIVAAGSGLRFGERKQFKELNNKSLYLYSLEKFISSKLIGEISLVVPTDLSLEISETVQKLSKKVNVVDGGELRQDSVLAGVNALSEDCTLVSVHDAARPFVSDVIINNTIESGKLYDGAIAAIPANDTVKEVSNNNHIKRTVPRETVWLAQTPQVFQRDKLLQALSYAKTNKLIVTDEATLLETLDFTVVVVEGSVQNFKITTTADWDNAQRIMETDND